MSESFTSPSLGLPAKLQTHTNDDVGHVAVLGNDLEAIHRVTVADNVAEENGTVLLHPNIQSAAMPSSARCASLSHVSVGLRQARQAATGSLVITAARTSDQLRLTRASRTPPHPSAWP